MVKVKECNISVVFFETQCMCTPNCNKLINPRLRYYYIRFLKINRCYFEIPLPVLTLMIRMSAVCGCVSVYQILPELDDRWQSYDVIFIFQGGGYGVANLLPSSPFMAYRIYERSKIICIPNFAQPCINYISGVYFDVSVVIGMWFCVGVPNSIHIGPSAAEL